MNISFVPGTVLNMSHGLFHLLPHPTTLKYRYCHHIEQRRSLRHRDASVLNKIIQLASRGEGRDQADSHIGKTTLLLSREAALVKFERTTADIQCYQTQRKGRSLRQASQSGWDFGWTLKAGLH